MGSLCAKRQRETEHLSDWELIEPFPEDVQRHIAALIPLNPIQRFAAELRNRQGLRRWIRAVFKILLIRRLRIRWSQAGSWLNVYRRGPAVNAALRERVSRAWAVEGSRALQAVNSRALFSHIRRHTVNFNSRLNRAVARSTEEAITTGTGRDQGGRRRRDDH